MTVSNKLYNNTQFNDHYDIITSGIWVMIISKFSSSAFAWGFTIVTTVSSFVASTVLQIKQNKPHFLV